jgi:hypothetical protein
VFQKENIFEEKASGIPLVGLDTVLEDRNVHRGGVTTPEEIRKIFDNVTDWSRASNRRNREIQGQNIFNSELPRGVVLGKIARFYLPENVSKYQRWHDKLGHVGGKIMSRCGVEGLKIPKNPFRCEFCIKGKMHRLGHGKSTVKKNFLPGESIHTDLQGPYVPTLEGYKYSQIFLDEGSRRVWTVRLRSKTDSDEAIRTVVKDSQARSGRKVKFLRTDGDGIFGRSKSFQELKDELGFVHTRPAPYDHDQNGLIDRECRTLLEGVSTSITQSGAPPSMWGEGVQHWTFTRNNIPRIEREVGGPHK